MSNIANSPRSLNYISSARSSLQIHELEHVSFECTDWPLPGISLNPARMATPFTDMPLRGDKLNYKSLTINFLVTEKLENWHELYQWFVGISAPTEFNEWCEKKFEYTDAVLHLYTSQQNKFAEVIFTNLVPVDLGDLSFTSQTGENDQITCTATFDYQSYKIRFTNDLHQEDDFKDQDRYTKANGNIDYEIRRY